MSSCKTVLAERGDWIESFGWTVNKVLYNIVLHIALLGFRMLNVGHVHTNQLYPPDSFYYIQRAMIIIMTPCMISLLKF
jgi:hypothetical protein